MASATMNHSRSRVWPSIAAATIVLVVACAALWWLAVPRHDLCFAIHPAPAGCAMANRVPLAAAWTAGLAVLYGVTVTVGLTAGRRRSALTVIALAVLAGAALVGYRMVLYGYI